MAVDKGFKPDQGWSWVILAAAFLCNVIFDGIIFSFGIFKFELIQYFDIGLGSVAWIGSSIVSVYALVGPLASILANRFGCRVVTIAGSLVAVTGFFICVFSPSFWIMILTYGIMGGVGFGLMYLCAYVMIGHYFDKRRALANGIASCGSGVGTFIFAPLSDLLISHFGWKGGMWIICGIVLNGVVMGACFRPPPTMAHTCVSKTSQGNLKEKKKLFSLSLLKTPSFFIFCTSSFLCMLGFMIPFIYLPDVALISGCSHSQAVMLVSIIGLTNTIGRIACGWVSDKSWGDPLKIYNAALILGGVATAACPWFAAFPALAIYATVFGLCIAAYVSLCAIILVEFLGLDKLSNAFGFLNFCRGVATIIGAPLAGSLYDWTKTFDLPFYVAGASIAAAGLICLPLRMLARCKSNPEDRCAHIDIQLRLQDLEEMDQSSESKKQGYRVFNMETGKDSLHYLQVDLIHSGYTGSTSSIAGFVSPEDSSVYVKQLFPATSRSNIEVRERASIRRARTMSLDRV